MAWWLLKTEPTVYSFDDLVRDRRTVWDGVTSNAALKNMRAVKEGDEAVVYHTGDERAAVGVARIASAPYPDPRARDSRLVVFNVTPERRLPRPVPLAAIKADRAFAASDLVRIPRLSVVPLPDALWRRLLALAGL